MSLRTLIASLFLIPCIVQAAEISGQVVSIADGDTLTLLDIDNNQHKIRLTEIDAPEKSQSFGKRSKQNLSDICYGKRAKVITNEVDRYNRLLGKVICNGVNANKAQVLNGYAWAYRQYVKDTSYYQDENDARINKRGLWEEARPTPPWEYRNKTKLPLDPL